MKRTLITILALSLVAVLAMPAFAEVQNIKIGGQITIRGFVRDNYSTTGSGGERAVTGFAQSDSRDWYNTITDIDIEADLTDNVATTVVIGNERDWQNSGSSLHVDVYSSYVTLKEMLYSPLTVKAGRMNVKLADGLMIGDGVRDETYLASDYSNETQFDTIHGILDYDPLTLIIGTIKTTEAAQTSSDDVDLYIIDAIYKFEDEMNTVLDAYLVNGHYNTPGTLTGPSSASTKGVDIYALAATLNTQPIGNLALKLGLAYQFGDYEKTAAASRDLKAYAFDIDVSYAFENDYSPKVGAKYIYRSGQDAGTTTGDYKGWLPLYESQVNGVIYDPNSNTNSIALNGSFSPVDRLTLGAEWWLYNLAKKQTTGTGKKDAGMELDLLAKYAYTEDVGLGLSLGWFFPGDYYATGSDKTATQAMLEMAVKF